MPAFNSISSQPIAVSFDEITAALTGTIIAAGVLESEIAFGNETLIITLTNDVFITGVSSKDGIVAGISGSASWNSEVRDNTDNTNVVLSEENTVATITFPAAEGYFISSDDIVTVIIPATSLALSTFAVTADSTFTVTNESFQPFWSSNIVTRIAI